MPVIVSFKGQEKEYVEIRANAFASRYLMPREFITQIPVQTWNQAEIVKWASQLKVSTHALAIALKEFGIIDDRAVDDLRQARVPAHQKIDPELANLPENVAARKESLLQRGLTNFYVDLCLEAWSRRIVSTGRAAEMLLVDDFELEEIGELFGVRVSVH